MNERLVALDIGDVRIGVAVSDASRLIATPVEVITRVGWGPDTKRIVEICQRYDTTEVLSGLPLNMDGTAGFQAEKVRGLCAQLEKAGLHVIYQDERLSTVAAEHALLEDNMSRANRKKHVDKVAAAVILQSWLDAQRQSESTGSAEPAGHGAEINQKKEAARMDDNRRDEQEYEPEERIVELIDEQGQTVRFEHMATLEHDGDYYIALCLADEEETSDEEDEGDIIFMKITEDDKGEECYVGVEDEALLDKLFDQLMVALDEEFSGMDSQEEE